MSRALLRGLQRLFGLFWPGGLTVNRLHLMFSFMPFRMNVIQDMRAVEACLERNPKLPKGDILI